MLVILFLALLLPLASEAQTSPERWTLVEELRIGSVDGPNSLTGVHPFTVSPDGREAYVGQRTEHLIRVFDGASGKLLRSIGRPGSGPGEFRGMVQAGWKGDTLFVVDMALQHASLFLPDGKHMRTERITSPPIPGIGIARLRAYLANGTAIGAPNYNLQEAASGSVTSVPWVQMTLDGRVLRTVGHRDVSNAAGTATFGGRFVVFTQPAHESSFLVVAPDGASLLIVHAAQSAAREARVQATRIGTGGDTIYHRAFRYTPRPFSRRELEEVLNARTEAMFPGAALAGAREVVREAIKFPPAHPPVSDVTVGDDGSAWLARGELQPGTANWLVLSPAGQIDATVQAPEGISIKAVRGETAWGVVHDDLDIPYVVRYRIRRLPDP